MRGCELGSFSEAEDYIRRGGVEGGEIVSQTEVLELARVMFIKVNKLCLRIWTLS